MRDLSMMSPQEIATKYGGDKRKIAQAVQMGLIDPTAALMAGMFIDRIRASAAQEQQPQATVAQETFQQEPVAMASGGLADLPVPDEMFDEKQYAGGGIVAFANRGEVDLTSIVRSQQEADPFYEDDETSGFDLGRARRYAELYRSLLPARGPASEELTKYIKEYGPRAQRLAEQQRAAAGLAAASKLLSTRGDFARGLGAAGEAATPGLMKAAESEAGAQESALKALAALEEKGRAEEIDAIKGGMGLYGKEVERKIAAGKDLNMDKYAKNFLEAYRGSPKFKDMTDAQIMQLGREDFLNRSGAALMRGQAALGGVDVSGGQLQRQLYDSARTIVENRLKSAPYQERLRHSRLSPEEKEAEIDNLVREELSRNPVAQRLLGTPSAGGAPAPAPAASPTASLAPPSPAAKGGQQKFSVTAPNGQVFNFDTKAQADAFKKRIGAQ